MDTPKCGTGFWPARTMTRKYGSTSHTPLRIALFPSCGGLAVPPAATPADLTIRRRRVDDLLPLHASCPAPTTTCCGGQAGRRPGAWPMLSRFGRINVNLAEIRQTESGLRRVVCLELVSRRSNQSRSTSLGHTR